MGLVFTYLLTFGGSAVALFRPYVGLLVYVCFALIKPDALWPWSVPVWNYSRFIAVCVLLGWVFAGFGSWRFFRARGIVLAFVGFWLWCIVSATQAPNQQRAWTFVEDMAKILLPILVGITTIDTVAKLKGLVWVIVLSQSFLAYEVNLSYFRGYNIIHEQGFAGLPDNNGVALTMHTCLPLAFFLGLQSRVWWQKALAFLCTGLLAHAVLLSFSREGMLGMLASLGMIFLLIPKKPKHYLLFAVAMLITLRLAGPDVRNRFFTVFAEEHARDDSANSRIKLWRNCTELMLKNPILGVGPNHFAVYSHQFGWPPGKEAHTLWLKMGAETGVIGMAFYLGYYGLSWLRVWRLRRAGTPLPDPWLRDAANMVLASLPGFAVCTMFNNLYGIEIPYFVAMVGAVAIKLASAAEAAAPAAGQQEFANPYLEPMYR